ncbi:MAG: hypothetical protein ACYS99_08065 [Planctomycetota bacterium]|jgi:mono/diheme cytochrome c family protein
MSTRRLIWAIPLLGAVFLVPWISSQEKNRIDPAKLFAKNCVACHSVPDPALETGRAWLDQVRRTT